MSSDQRKPALMAGFRRPLVVELGCLAILAATWLASRFNSRIANGMASLLTHEMSTEYFPTYFRGRLPHNLSSEYSRELRRLGEKPLPHVTDEDDIEAYRFLWLRSWERAVVFRIQRVGKQFTLVAEAPAERAQK